MRHSYHDSDVVKVAVVAQSATSPQPLFTMEKACAIALVGMALLGYWLV